MEISLRAEKTGTVNVAWRQRRATAWRSIRSFCSSNRDEMPLCRLLNCFGYPTSNKDGDRMHDGC